MNRKGIKAEFNYHTARWIDGVGERAALMKFNGASNEQITAQMWRDWPDGEVEYETYLGMARAAYRRMWSRLSRYVGKGYVARLTWTDDLVFAPADRLDGISDAGWNWVKELRGV
jgi:hypothetical protein